MVHLPLAPSEGQVAHLVLPLATCPFKLQLEGACGKWFWNQKTPHAERIGDLTWAHPNEPQEAQSTPPRALNILVGSQLDKRERSRRSSRYLSLQRLSTSSTSFAYRNHEPVKEREAIQKAHIIRGSSSHHAKRQEPSAESTAGEKTRWSWLFSGSWILSAQASWMAISGSEADQQWWCADGASENIWTRSATIRDRNLQLRGIFSDFFIIPSGFSFFPQVVCVSQ